jgi:DNA primase
VTAGVELDERPLSPAERQARKDAESERDRMYRAMDLAAQFYQDAYAGPTTEAERARDYVAKRGITAKVAERFRVGYAPARWDALQSFLASKKIPATDVERLGLAGVNERGRYDFFRDRVMLPVIDRQKRVIGFGGRLLDPDAKDRKYVNSPDSPLFHKKEQLYGLHAALDAIRRGGVAIVVEGNFDVLSLHEAGIEEAVAPMGTALTDEQIGILGRIAKTVVVVFDGDAAGQRAAQKAVPLFVEADVDGRVARMPAGVDPDDFVKTEGAAAFRRLVEGARPMLDQFIQDSVQEAGIQGTVSALETVAHLLVKVRNQTTRELYAGQLGAKLGLTAEQVRRALRQAAQQGIAGPRMPTATATPGTPAASGGAPAPAPAARRPLPPEELHFLVLLASYPELGRSADAARGGELLVDPATRQMYRGLAEQVALTGRIDIPAWIDSAPADVRDTVGAALMDGSIAHVADPPKAISKLCAKLQRLRVDAEITMYQKLQSEARSRGDDAAERAMTHEIIRLEQTKEGLKAALQRP